MRIYKRGNIYWIEFIVDNKRYQMSTKTKDKKLAEEIAAALQADVSTHVVVKASFNEALNALSFNRSTFLLIGPNGEKVAGKVYYNPNSLTNYIATFTPLKPLRPNTEYTAELTAGIMGNLKQHLAKNYVWRFTTGN
jgi:hypothetical protein